MGYIEELKEEKKTLSDLMEALEITTDIETKAAISILAQKQSIYYVLLELCYQGIELLIPSISSKYFCIVKIQESSEFLMVFEDHFEFITEVHNIIIMHYISQGGYYAN